MGNERHHTPRLLLRGGLVIDTAPHPVVHPHTDVLVEAGRIAAVGRDLPLDDSDTGLEVIDARTMVVLPGFVDAHRHLWQGVLRSAAVDASLDGYFSRVLGDLAGRFTPADVHTGNLLGALDCLDSGITTVQDFSHVQYSPEHTAAAVEALWEAGIRAVFGYGYPVFDESARQADWVRKARTAHFPSRDARVTMALAPVGPSFTPPEAVREDWLLARELGLPVAVHVSAGPVAMRPITAPPGAGAAHRRHPVRARQFAARLRAAADRRVRRGGGDHAGDRGLDAVRRPDGGTAAPGGHHHGAGRGRGHLGAG